MDEIKNIYYMEKIPNNLEYTDIKTIYNDLFVRNSFKKEPIKIKNIINVNINDFINEIKNFEVETSINDNVDITSEKIKYCDFINNNINRYVFHNITNDDNLIPIIEKYVPLPHFIKAKRIKDLRISRLYTGKIYTGCNIHTHSTAFNYLLSGKKLWFVFPNVKNNFDFVIKNKFNYGNISEKTIDWFNNNYNLLKVNIKNLQIFIQEKNEIIYIPDNYFHGVINLDFVIGITYSF